MLRWAVLWDSGMREKTYLTGESFLTQVGFSQPPSWSHEAHLLAPWCTHSAYLLTWPPCYSFPLLCPSCSLGRSLRPGVTLLHLRILLPRVMPGALLTQMFAGNVYRGKIMLGIPRNSRFSEADMQPAHQGAGELTRALEEMSPRGWAKTQEENQDSK